MKDLSELNVNADGMEPQAIYTTIPTPDNIIEIIDRYIDEYEAKYNKYCNCLFLGILIFEMIKDKLWKNERDNNLYYKDLKIYYSIDNEVYIGVGHDGKIYHEEDIILEEKIEAIHKEEMEQQKKED